MNDQNETSNDKSNNKHLPKQGSDTFGVLTRRGFLAKSFAAAGTLFIPTAASAQTIRNVTRTIASAAVPGMAALTSTFNFKGQIIGRDDPDFAKYAFGEIFNALRPDRAPDVLVRPLDEQDVVAAVKFAKANKMKVSIRGGGHNWCSPSLRNSGMLIDLQLLNKVISIDAGTRKAIVQPFLSNREIAASLGEHDMAYPTGHCPPVKLSGYLLSGGMSWNQGVWGHGCESVEAIELVTADGELITASADQNTDYFWAARGAGPGLFAVAVRYHLKLYPLPKAITASVYYYPYETVMTVTEWLGPLAAKLPPSVELSLFIVEAPAAIQAKCKSSNGKVAMVTATMFADDRAEAVKTLKLLDTCPILDQCLSKSVAQPSTFPQLFDASGDLWPADLRCKVDAIFSSATLSEMMGSVGKHCVEMKSKKTVFMFAIFTGPNVPAKVPEGTAFSMTGTLYGGPWTMWEAKSDDAANIEWHEKCLKLMKPHINGHYVSETDTVGHPAYLKLSYSPANWERLTTLRKKYDPHGVFWNYTDGLT